jgi:hypothetical protein
MDATQLAGIETGGKACATCHSATLKVAHSTTSTQTVLTQDGKVTCVECHADTSLDSSATVAANWTNALCTDCHDTGAAKTHDAYATAHTISAGRGCAGSGPDCHGTSTSLAELHSANKDGGPPLGLSCANNGCHTTKDARPAAIPPDSCGKDSAGGCHILKTPDNHGSQLDHAYTSASDYRQTANTAGSETGCTNSGSGCHGTAPAARDALVDYHSSASSIRAMPLQPGRQNGKRRAPT